MMVRPNRRRLRQLLALMWNTGSLRADTDEELAWLRWTVEKAMQGELFELPDPVANTAPPESENTIAKGGNWRKSMTDWRKWLDDPEVRKARLAYTRKRRAARKREEAALQHKEAAE